MRGTIRPRRLRAGAASGLGGVDGKEVPLEVGLGEPGLCFPDRNLIFVE